MQAGAAMMFLRVLRPHRGGDRPTRERMQKLLRSGVHFAVRSIAMFAVWNTATAVAAHVDTPTLAAHQVLTQLFMFLALMLDALAIPAQSLVAGALGADDTKQALLVGRTSNRLSLWCAVLLASVLAVLSPVLPHVFSGDPAVHSRLTAGLLILAVMQFPGAIAFAFDGALIGAHDERWLARQAVINLVGFAPLAIATLIVPATRPRRAVGCGAVVDDAARIRQLAALGVATMAAGSGIDASNRAVSRTDVALRPLPAA